MCQVSCIVANPAGSILEGRAPKACASAAVANGPAVGLRGSGTSKSLRQLDGAPRWQLNSISESDAGYPQHEARRRMTTVNLCKKSRFSGHALGCDDRRNGYREHPGGRNARRLFSGFIFRAG
jgi:hypothetical protein